MPKPTKFDGMMHDYGKKGWLGWTVDGKRFHVTDFIPDKGLVNANQFVSWLIEAEGFESGDPRINDIKLRKTLVEVFIKHMGTNEIDASFLK